MEHPDTIGKLDGVLSLSSGHGDVSTRSALNGSRPRVAVQPVAAPLGTAGQPVHLGIGDCSFAGSPRDLASAELNRKVAELAHRTSPVAEFGVLHRPLAALHAADEVLLVAPGGQFDRSLIEAGEILDRTPRHRESCLSGLPIYQALTHPSSPSKRT